MQSDILYVGTHGRPHRADPIDIAFGIYQFDRRTDRPGLYPAGMYATAQPGWIAMHPSGRTLYVVNEVTSFNGRDGGGVSAFAVDQATGSLRYLNSCHTRSMPCHCRVDATGQFLLVASYGGGVVYLFRLAPEGTIESESDVQEHVGSSVHPVRQSKPHPHEVIIDSANRFVFVPDLGTDLIYVYELETVTGKLVARPERNVPMSPGSGPRHMTFDAQERFGYLMSEMAATISVFAYDRGVGSLQLIQTVDALPAEFAGFRSGAEIGIHPSGQFLYATTRSHTSSGEPPVRGLDSVVWFKIDQQDGTLHSPARIPSGGEVPRSFAFDPSDGLMYVGNQISGTIVPFRIEPKTGEPIRSGDVIATPVPVCLLFVSRA